MRIARLQLRDAHAAEDVVQETLLAALRSAPTFSGRSSVKTWLVGILRFKIVDLLRARARTPMNATDLGAELKTDDLDALFDSTGTWIEKPREWGDPDRAVAQADFQRVLELCLSRLPELAARVFMLRELFELDAEEVCRLAAVKRNHLNVLLYRARLSLRGCLETRWMADGGSA